MGTLLGAIREWFATKTGCSVIDLLFVSLLCEHCIISGLYMLHAIQNSQADDSTSEVSLHPSRGKRSVQPEFQNKSVVQEETTIVLNTTKRPQIHNKTENIVIEKLKVRITADDKLMQKLRYQPTSVPEFLQMYEHYCKLRGITSEKHHSQDYCPCIPTQLGKNNTLLL